MPSDPASLRLRRMSQNPADGAGEQGAFAGAEKQAGEHQHEQVCRHHVADAADEAKDGAGHRHAASATLIGKPSRDRTGDHGGQGPDRHGQAGGDRVRTQPLMGIGRHDLDGHADRPEAKEAGRPEPPVGHGAAASGVAIGVPLQHVIKSAYRLTT